MNIVLFDSSPASGWKDAITRYAWKQASKSKHFGARINTKNWDEAVFLLGVLSSDLAVQYWGHGLPAEAYCGNGVLSQPHLERMASLKLEYLWLRCCYVAAWAKGRNWMMMAAEILGCPVIAHTHEIGFPYHSGLVTVKPGVVPEYNVYRGVPLDQLKSGRKQPGTIHTWEMELPKWA